MLRSLKLLSKPEPILATLPEGFRLYAIGDIHGRADLLRALLAAVERDDSDRAAADSQIIFLGDFVDRGPASAEVIDIVLELRERRPLTRCLMGNHEEVFLRVLQGDIATLGFFLSIGGRETLLSYGLSATEIDESADTDLLALMAERVPERHRLFLDGLSDMVIAGDYAFVHAGIRPGVDLEEQIASDLRWIREPFLSHRGSLGSVVVHGHTITNDVDERPSRIGIDTGAFQTGRLTAIGLEGNDRWYLST